MITEIDVKNYLSDAVENDIMIYDSSHPGYISNRLLGKMMDYAASNDDYIVEWILPDDCKFTTSMCISNVALINNYHMLEPMAIAQIPVYFSTFLNEDGGAVSYFQDKLQASMPFATEQLVIARFVNTGYILGCF